MDIERKAEDLEQVKELSHDLQSILNVSSECFNDPSNLQWAEQPFCFQTLADS